MVESIGSWICLTHKTYTCHTLQCCACRLYSVYWNESMLYNFRMSNYVQQRKTYTRKAATVHLNCSTVPCNMLCARIAAAVWRKRRDVICEMRGTRPWYAVPLCKTYPCQKKNKRYHASRNEACRLTCICLMAAHIHGTILFFYLFTFYFLHNPTLHVTSYHVKMWRSGKMLLKFQILNANYCCAYNHSSVRYRPRSCIGCKNTAESFLQYFRFWRHEGWIRYARWCHVLHCIPQP
jgi:hypothetical protein